ncbi:MAG: hypothetical protein JW891_02995 [Candidatus Lokiarchaeota archaeon]|nr:hypothetical protein [Candidatus Lokiarchaeota archaeon]
MKKVKGSLVKILVRSVRLNKTGAYDHILSSEGQELVHQRIFDSIWYTYEAYRNVYDAVAKIEANNNQKILFQWGQKFGEIIMTSIYKNSMIDNDVSQAIDKYARFHKLVYTWGRIKPELLSDYHLIVTYEDFERDWELYYYISSGWMHKYLELCLKKPITFKFYKKSWEGADWTTYDFMW